MSKSRFPEQKGTRDMNGTDVLFDVEDELLACPRASVPHPVIAATELDLTPVAGVVLGSRCWTGSMWLPRPAVARCAGSGLGAMVAGGVIRRCARCWLPAAISCPTGHCWLIRPPWRYAGSMRYPAWRSCTGFWPARPSGLSWDEDRALLHGRRPRDGCRCVNSDPPTPGCPYQQDALPYLVVTLRLKRLEVAIRAIGLGETDAYAMLLGVMGSGVRAARSLVSEPQRRLELRWGDDRTGIVVLGQSGSRPPFHAMVVTERSVAQYEPKPWLLDRSLLEVVLPSLVGQAEAPLRPGELVEAERCALAARESREQASRVVPPAGLAPKVAYDGREFALAHRRQRYSRGSSGQADRADAY